MPVLRVHVVTAMGHYLLLSARVGVTETRVFPGTQSMGWEGHRLREWVCFQTCPLCLVGCVSLDK